MYRVLISTTCGCITKKGIATEELFESKDEALNKASALTQQMNEEFCQKHSFDFTTIGSDFLINFQRKR